MSRPLFARSAKGHLVSRLQRVLSGGGFYSGIVDGDYGGGTERAVSASQQAAGLPETGRADDVTWKRVMHADIPPLFERCLQLTARIEGHGFTMVAGNFDGAGLTWGIIGFTLKGGELTAIIREVFTSNPAAVQRAFGDRTEELMSMLAANWKTQLAWADSISSGTRKTTVVEPWRSAFARLGAEDLVQANQLRRAEEDYFVPATQTAKSFGLTTELGSALCFDVHVQNGGVRDAARAVIKAGLKKAKDQQARRLLIGNAVVDQSSKTFREDVRKRKVAIATGEGDVHGEHLRLESWGLGEFLI